MFHVGYMLSLNPFIFQHCFILLAFYTIVPYIIYILIKVGPKLIYYYFRLQDGVILAWKGTCESNLTFQLAATLKGHTHGITSLVVGGGNRLYSGSKDHTIRVSFFSSRFIYLFIFLSFMLWVVSIWRELDY